MCSELGFLIFSKKFFKLIIGNRRIISLCWIGHYRHCFWKNFCFSCTYCNIFRNCITLFFFAHNISEHWINCIIFHIFRISFIFSFYIKYRFRLSFKLAFNYGFSFNSFYLFFRSSNLCTKCIVFFYFVICIFWKTCRNFICIFLKESYWLSLYSISLYDKFITITYFIKSAIFTNIKLVAFTINTNIMNWSTTFKSIWCNKLERSRKNNTFKRSTSCSGTLFYSGNGIWNYQWF